jgi:AAA domain (dynein-related subfamily)
MTPQALTRFLKSLVEQKIQLSVMIWGPPGIGKSSIVAQTAAAHQLDWIDVRLSQLAPTDLRGLPVPDHDHRSSRWYPPEFLPRSGRGILFLDEINMAPPAMQGMAQQLILDRRVGSYVVPDGWFIWSAGNRKEDRAAVFDMPAPLANRFLHLFVEPDFDSFKAYALASGVHEQILAFLAYRTELLHKIDPTHPAWPSPRSWVMASTLHSGNLSIEPVVGPAAYAEFQAYRSVYENLPDLDKILQGTGEAIPFPKEPSVRYATVMGLMRRAIDLKQSIRAFRWMVQKASSEWTQMFVSDLVRYYESMGKLGVLVASSRQEQQLRKYIQEYLDLLGEDLSDGTE